MDTLSASNPASEALSARRSVAASRRRQLREKVIEGLVTGVGMMGIAAVLLIIIFVAKEAVPLFTEAAARAEAGLGKMFLPQVLRAGKPATFMWQPVSAVPKVSLIPLLLGTLKVTVVALVASVPVGVSAAIFASEFSSARVREWLKPTVELLAGIPSVVLGFFALMVLASFLQTTFGFTFRLNAVVAGLGLALAIVPVVFTVSEDALNAVPRSYREASLALGATRWETAFQVVLPAAAPGIMAACVLGFGRAIGETMIVLMASGNAAIVSSSVGDSVRTLSATIAAEMGEVVVGSTHYALLFFLGILLFFITFIFNLGAAAWIRTTVRRLGGAGAAR